MQQTRKFRFASAGAARVLLVAIGAGASALACSSDHALGNLAPDDLLDHAGDSPATGEVGPDLTVSSVLAPPEVSMDAGTDVFLDLQIATGLGDVDGDGFGDFAANGYDGASAKHYLHLRYGGPRPGDQDDIFALAESGARLILRSTGGVPAMLDSFSPIGDVDGDGFADFLVGWGQCPPGRSPTVYLVYGGAERLDGVRSIEDAGVLLQSPSASESAPDYCGSGGGVAYFAGLGDFDGDGFDDFMLTERPESDADTDSVAYLFYGRAQRITTGTLWRDADAQLTADQHLGLAPLRDVNGDGLGDVVIGGRSVPSADGQTSKFFWLPGRTERLSGSTDVAAVGTPINEASAAGDLDADGIHEVLLHDFERGPHLFYGAPGLFDAGADLSQAAATFDAYRSPTRERFFLLRVTTAGDRDGDGDDELAAGVSVNPRHPSAFEVALVSGARQRSSGTVAFDDPGQPFEEIGAALHGLFPVGDLDDDGATELVSLSRRYTMTVDGDELESSTDLNIHYGTPGGHSSSPLR